MHLIASDDDEIVVKRRQRKRVVSGRGWHETAEWLIRALARQVQRELSPVMFKADVASDATAAAGAKVKKGSCPRGKGSCSPGGQGGCPRWSARSHEGANFSWRQGISFSCRRTVDGDMRMVSGAC